MNLHPSADPSDAAGSPGAATPNSATTPPTHPGDAEEWTAHLPGAAYIFEASPEGVFSFPFVSAACADIYGFTAQEAMANAALMHDAIHPEDRDSFERTGQRSAQQLCPMHWEGRIRRPDGHVRNIAISSRPQRLPNNAIQWHGVVIDRTEAHERDLTTQRELMRLNQHQGDMIAMAAHDIGSPLASVLGFAEQALSILDSEHQDTNETGARDADLRDYLRRITRNANRIDELRRDLLIAQAWQTGRLAVEAQPVFVRSRIMTAADMLPAGPELHISCPPNLRCYAHPSHVDQMLTNLLTNAGRFAREQVTVEARALADRVAITVLDDGPGVPSEFVDTLFDRFTRAHSPQGTGTGLGLFITHKLATANAGTLSYEAAHDGGAAFILELPRYDGVKAHNGNVTYIGGKHHFTNAE